MRARFIFDLKREPETEEENVRLEAALREATACVERADAILREWTKHRVAVERVPDER